MAKKRGRPKKKREYKKVDTVEPDIIRPCQRCTGTDYRSLRKVEQALGNGASVTYHYRKCIVCGQTQRQVLA